MRHLAPFALSGLVVVLVGCSGDFTELGTAGAGGMAGSAGSGASGSAGKPASGGSSGSGAEGGGSTGGSGAKGGTGGGATGGTGGSGGTSSGGTSNGGTGAMGGSGGGFDPCANKACGAECSDCDPAAGQCNALVKYCDDQGACGLNYPVCSGGGTCKTVADCPAIPLACQVCPDGSASCPTIDCVNGQCTTSYPTCSVPECKTDADCPVSLAPCQLCPDGSTACPWAHCLSGKCSSGIDTCDNSDPCKGKACGDLCNTCAAGTACPSVAMYCDANLKCQLNQPVCSEPQCKEDADCTTDVCGKCTGSDQCAAQICVGGQCTFQCPKADPCGGCPSGEVCVEQIGGPAIPASGNFVCAVQEACGSALACACIQGQGTCMANQGDAPVDCVCDNGIR